MSVGAPTSRLLPVARLARRGGEVPLGMVPHAGPDSALFDEVCRLGELHTTRLGPLVGSSVDAQVAILWDYEAQWGLMGPALPSALVQYGDLAVRMHRALAARQVTCAVVHPRSDLSAYRLILVPTLYLVGDAALANVTAAADAGRMSWSATSPGSSTSPTTSASGLSGRLPGPARGADRGVRPLRDGEQVRHRRPPSTGAPGGSGPKCVPRPPPTCSSSMPRAAARQGRPDPSGGVRSARWFSRPTSTTTPWPPSSPRSPTPLGWTRSSRALRPGWTWSVGGRPGSFLVAVNHNDEARAGGDRARPGDRRRCPRP